MEGANTIFFIDLYLDMQMRTMKYAESHLETRNLKHEERVDDADVDVQDVQGEWLAVLKLKMALGHGRQLYIGTM